MSGRTAYDRTKYSFWTAYPVENVLARTNYQIAYFKRRSEVPAETRGHPWPRKWEVPAKPEGWAKRRSPPGPLTDHETISEENTVTQAAVGGTQAANCEAPERTSPTSWRSHVTEYANILWQHRYVSTESEKCPVERPLPGQNTHFEQLIR